MPRVRPEPLRTRPRVSVVVPCYNYGHFLPQAVGSALDQEGVDVDVLVVDDASTDDSAVVARDLESRDSRVRVFRHETNRGHIQTYNDGLARVEADYVVLLSADDVLTTNSLTRATALLEARPDVGLVYGIAATFDDVPPTPGTENAASWTVWSGDTWLKRVCARARNTIVNPEVVMRRSLLQELGGGYDPAHPHAGDMLLWLRSAQRTGIGRVNGPVQAGYRVHGANMHSTTFAGALTDLRHIKSTFETLFEEHPDAQLHRRAMRGLVREARLTAAVQQLRGVDCDRLAEFAETCQPGVTATWRWRRCRRRATDGTGALEALAVGTVDGLRWKLRSQRSRRWGT